MRNSRLAYVLQDWEANASAKGRFVVALFRVAQLAGRAPRPLSLLGKPYLAFYRLFVEWILGIELPWSVRVGPNFQLGHGHGLVVHPNTTIGANCLLRQTTSIGDRGLWEDPDDNAPTIGDNVNIGANVVILGPISVGSNTIIGAGSVVVKDVPDGAIVVGNPARIVRMQREQEAGSKGEPVAARDRELGT